MSVTKFYIVKPEYGRTSEAEKFRITGVQFRRTGKGVPAAYSNYADAREAASYLYKNCGWIAPLVVAATAETSVERQAMVPAKALDCYAGRITIRQAGKP